MDTQEFEQIKKKIDILKEKRAKAKGIIENTLATAKTQYDLNSIEEMEEKLEALQSEYDANNVKIDAWFAELKGLTNWALI